MKGQKQCTTCGEWKPLTEFYKRPDIKNGLKPNCKQCYNTYYRNRDKQIRNDVLQIYGTVCANCGFDHVPSLTIHHKNNDGFMDNGGNGGPRNAWKKYITDPPRDDLMVLCNSCHQAVHSIDGEAELVLLRLIGRVLRGARNHRICEITNAARKIKCLKK